MTNCLLCISCAGTKTPLREHPQAALFMKALEGKGVEFKVVDTVAGWGCLNQDWIEFRCEVETSWSWCRPTIFSEAEWEFWFEQFHSGVLLMHVEYETADGKLVPHH